MTACSFRDLSPSMTGFGLVYYHVGFIYVNLISVELFQEQRRTVNSEHLQQFVSDMEADLTRAQMVLVLLFSLRVNSFILILPFCLLES